MLCEAFGDIQLHWKHHRNEDCFCSLRWLVSYIHSVILFFFFSSYLLVPKKPELDIRVETDCFSKWEFSNNFICYKVFPFSFKSGAITIYSSASCFYHLILFGRSLIVLGQPNFWLTLPFPTPLACLFLWVSYGKVRGNIRGPASITWQALNGNLKPIRSVSSVFMLRLSSFFVTVLSVLSPAPC
jgi:hypothetical protein